MPSRQFSSHFSSVTFSGTSPVSAQSWVSAAVLAQRRSMNVRSALPGYSSRARK